VKRRGKKKEKGKEETNAQVHHPQLRPVHRGERNSNESVKVEGGKEKGKRKGGGKGEEGTGSGIQASFPSINPLGPLPYALKKKFNEPTSK